MPVIIANQEEIREYFESSALGQSKLKRLLGDVSFFEKEFDASAEHFLIGKAVDCILTDSREAFLEQFYVSDVEKKPSDAIVEIINIVFEKVKEDYEEMQSTIEGDTTSLLEFAVSLEQVPSYILDACSTTGWNSRYKDETKIKTIIESGDEFYKDLCSSDGKIILSQKQNETVQLIVMSLETHPRTSRFFNRKMFEALPHVTIYYQFPIYFEHKGIECKALLDMVVVERTEEGQILEITPIDLKTMQGNTFHFLSSVKRLRYDIQAAWYTLAIKDYFAIDETIVKPFMFVVESTTFTGKPLVFEMTPNLLKIGREGKKAVSLVTSEDTSNVAFEYAQLRQPILGYEDLIDLYLFHTEHGFDEEREVKEAEGKALLLDWDGYESRDISLANLV